MIVAHTHARTHTRARAHRFGFLALRVGVGRLLRLLGTALAALAWWLLSQLDYARDLRARPPPTAA